MSIDRVQLSQEEYTGSQVNRTDINPVTNTSSVMDPDTGGDLKSVIDRLWSAINSKLERVVNSVNNKDGIVVLTSEDVGLGNVDNVSFADIKEWVLEQINKAFKNKSLRLFSNYSEFDSIDKSDLTLDGVPFFIENWNAEILGTMEHRAAIGVFYIASGTTEIHWDYKFINVINDTDGSIEYSHGVAGVKIHDDEVALQKDANGLFIDPAFLSGNILFVNGFYDGATPLLLTNTTGIPVDIYLNNDLIGADHYVNPSFTGLKAGVILITNWNTKLSGSSYAQGTDPLLMGRQPAIGRVEFTDTPVDKYTFKLYSIRSYVGANNGGYGLGYYFDPDNTESIKNNNLGVKLVEGSVSPAGGNRRLNYSGLISGISGFPNPFNPDDAADVSQTIITPNGMTPGDSIHNNGLMIATNHSICVTSLDAYGPCGDWRLYPDDKKIYMGSNYAKNWWMPYRTDGEWIEADDHDPEYTKYSKERGYASTMSVLGLKMNKLQTSLSQPATDPTTQGPYIFSDISGLKIRFAHSLGVRFGQDQLPLIGITDGKDAVGNDIDMSIFKSERGPNYFDAVESGGIQINVGKFLEICPKKTETALEYEDGGKVQVRIGHGLQEELSYVKITEQFPQGTEGLIEKEWAYSDYTLIPESKYMSDVIDNGVDEHDNPIPPEDWEHTYLDYYVRTGESPDYVYTKNTRHYDIDEMTYEDIVPEWENGKYCKKDDAALILYLNNMIVTDDYIYQVLRPNRIAVDMDVVGVATYTPGESYVAKQLVVDNYKLYLVTADFTATDINTDKTNGFLVSVGGGGDSGPLRFVDVNGRFFDYNNPSEIAASIPNDNTVLQKKTVVKLSEGLKIVGGAVSADQLLTRAKLESEAIGCLEQISFLGLKELYNASSVDISEYTIAQVLTAYANVGNTITGAATYADLYDVYRTMLISIDSGEAALISNYDNYQYQTMADVGDRIHTISDVVNSSASKVALISEFLDHYSLEEVAGYTIDDYSNSVKYKDLGWMFNEFSNYVIDPSTIPSS